MNERDDDRIISRTAFVPQDALNPFTLELDKPVKLTTWTEPNLKPDERLTTSDTETSSTRK